ncbi:MAG: Crp/Fnr family transcriptional regulator [Clostridia bacterium]|nr:Crp/Fnr family transcriptional regulator [Clostridia bacterium]
MEYCKFSDIYSEFFPFWDNLQQGDKDLLCANTKSVKYQKGESIHDGNECTGVIIVKSGCLRVSIVSDDGKEITLYRLFDGDMCMLSASCVLQTVTFDVFVDAEEDSDCCVISGPVFATVSDRNPQMKIFSLETAVSRFSDVMWVMQQILFMSFDKRLAIFLMDEISKTGDSTIKMTHEQIAKYMGSAREVVSRMLKYFSSEGIVELSRGGIKIIDRKKLRELTL